jgi:hypothetical protein
MLFSRLAPLFGLAAFLLNPSFACSSSEADYQYGEAELRAAVEGDWSLRVERSAGAPLELTLRLAQSSGTSASALPPRVPGRSLLRSAHACGTRTLVASAHACVDSTEMPLSVDFVAGDSSFASAALSGNFRVDSLIFDVGILHLALGELRVTAHVDVDGNVSSATLDSTLAGNARLERVSR